MTVRSDWIMEDTHLCAVLMPIQDNHGLSEISVLFVEFRELEFGVISI